MKDPFNPPDPVTCPNCHTKHDWVWFDQLSRWAYPSIRALDPPVGGEEHNPVGCNLCKDDLRKEAEANWINKQLARVDVPVRYRHWSFADSVWQQETDHPDHFRDRCMEEGKMGFYMEDHGDLQKIFKWIEYIKDPSAYKKRKGISLWLHGEPGTGKSSLACCIIREITSVGSTKEVSWDEYCQYYARKYKQHVDEVRRQLAGLKDWDGPGGKFFKGSGGVQCKWIDEEELLEAQRKSWKGEPGPLYKAVKFQGVVVLDDFHRAASGKDGKASSFNAEVLEKFICARYNKRLPTIITSNLNPMCRRRDDGKIDKAYPGLAGSGYGQRVQRRVDEIYESVWINANGKRWEGV